MATVTLQYDGRNKTAQAVIKILESLGIFKIYDDTRPKYDPDFVSKIRRGEEDFEEGRCVSIKPEDIWK